MIKKIEAQGVKTGSVKHIKSLPIIVDCELIHESKWTEAPDPDRRMGPGENAPEAG